MASTYYIYILECKNNSFYIGYTTDIMRRYQEHCEGSAKSKYTRAFPPKRIASCWQFDTEVGKILSLEAALKKLSRQQKIDLVNNPETLKNHTKLKFNRIQLAGRDLKNTDNDT